VADNEQSFPLCPKTLRWAARQLRDVSDKHGLNGEPLEETGHTRPGPFTTELNGIYAAEWNKAEGARHEEKRRCWFFGVWPGTGGGHYFRASKGRTERSVDRLQPFGYPDGVWQPDNDQVEGSAALTIKDGWTILAWWDRSEDTRRGCCSAVIFEGEHSFSSMVDLVKERFPKVYARRPLTQWHGNVRQKGDRYY
jgi:hypothetical protein